MFAFIWFFLKWKSVFLKVIEICFQQADEKVDNSVGFNRKRYILFVEEIEKYERSLLDLF